MLRVTAWRPVDSYRQQDSKGHSSTVKMVSTSGAVWHAKDYLESAFAVSSCLAVQLSHTILYYTSTAGTQCISCCLGGCDHCSAVEVHVGADTYGCGCCCSCRNQNTRDEKEQVQFLIYCLEHASRLADEQREYQLVASSLHLPSATVVTAAAASTYAMAA
eukprot:GHUV01020495.1.p1 GENE.GHUV01020495.1~~GHUV01020495.1.p1  ORF type:complete len:161 (+),score=22.13 GHUV01020495.1:1233-1715(+)